jgi:hypothetical protein
MRSQKKTRLFIPRGWAHDSSQFAKRKGDKIPGYPPNERTHRANGPELSRRSTAVESFSTALEVPPAPFVAATAVDGVQQLLRHL